MKLKPNVRILFGLIILLILALGGCSAPSTASGINVETITVVITNSDGTPIHKAGISVTASNGASVVAKETTASDGTATLAVKNVQYPLAITASDGAHRFSTFKAASAADMQTKISIVEAR